MQNKILKPISVKFKIISNELIQLDSDQTKPFQKQIGSIQPGTGFERKLTTLKPLTANWLIISEPN